MKLQKKIAFKKDLGCSTDAATSLRLSRIRQRGTKPELEVRRALSRLGIRYRVENRDLPGSPDLANRRKRWAVFVHGCYWHSHPGCSRATLPKRNRAFWEAKFEANRQRDARALQDLRARGFRTLVIWECKVGSEMTERRLTQFVTEGGAF